MALLLKLVTLPVQAPLQLRGEAWSDGGLPSSSPYGYAVIWSGEG